MIRLGLVIICLFTGATLHAQATNLPKGVGAYFFGYRQLAPQTQRYNDNGQLEPLAKPLQKDFNGPKLLEGVGGTRLKELARHMQRYDSYSQADNSLLNSLNLGALDGSVEGNISGRSFGLGFGITDNLSALVAVPFVSASVRTEIQFRGANNAQQIKRRLGALAFEDLQSGLDAAAQITTNQIKQTIEQEGYAPLDQWSYNGVGDISLGTIYGFKSNTGYSGIDSKSSIETMLTLPTGYVDDPDILTDVSIGRGYYSLGGKLRQNFTFYNRFSLMGSAGANLNLPTRVEKRVPSEQEAIIAYDRKATVDLRPGHDLNLSGGTGVRLNFVSLNATLGHQLHTRDHYSGPIEGNYDALARTSETSQTFVELSTLLSTAELYRAGKFAVPFILMAKYHQPIAAKNSLDERYFEVSLASFFTTPLASKGSKYKGKKRRKKAEFSYRKSTGFKKNKRKLNRKKHRGMYGHHH